MKEFLEPFLSRLSQLRIDSPPSDSVKKQKTPRVGSCSLDEVSRRDEAGQTAAGSTHCRLSGGEGERALREE